MKKIHLTLMVSLVFLISLSVVMAEINSITPSTNDENREKGWAHVNIVEVGVGEITLEFIQPRYHSVCFEYRRDGNTDEMVDPNNQNPDITDGQYNDVCLTNGARIETFNAEEYLEIRLVSRADPLERFDWTLFEVLPKTRASALTLLRIDNLGITTALGLQKEIPNENFAQANI